ncbi:MAG: hypothetical protein LBT05_03075 [Planctomycetaceae bacterium]|nr:hypothetical protein [Planctomycetaceae bacterium]
MENVSIILAFLFFSVCAAVFLSHQLILHKLRSQNQIKLLKNAKELFYWQREWLEAKFVTYAKSQLDVNTWIWNKVEFGNHILIAQSKREGVVYAYLPVVVEMRRPSKRPCKLKKERFYRRLTVIAKFIEATNKWEITGRAFFNQTPSDVIQNRAQELQFIDSIDKRAA